MKFTAHLNNSKLTNGIGMSAVILAMCFLLVTEPFPGAEAQFGFGANRFFRNFQRGASNVFRPMFRMPNMLTQSRPQSSRPRFPFLPQR